MSTPAGSLAVFHLAVAEENRQRKRLLQARIEYSLDRKTKLGRKALTDSERPGFNPASIFLVRGMQIQEMHNVG